MAGTPWHHGPSTPYDVESTGTDVFTDRIVTATVIDLDPRRTNTAAGAAAPQSWLLDPGIDIPAGATDVHGITTEKARAEGGDPAQVLPLVAQLLCASLDDGVPVIAMNAAFDFTMLHSELLRHGHSALAAEFARLAAHGPVVDPYVIDKAFDTYRPGKRTLTALCQHYQVRLDGAHDATEDALAAARVLWKQMARYPELAAMALPNLHRAQTGWRREQCASLESYFRRKDPNCASVPGGWPLYERPAAEEGAA